MFKHLVALVVVALAAAFVSPAVAQQPPGTSVGTLACKMAPSIGLIFGSRQRMACRFTPNGSNPPEEYVGVMGTIGLDVCRSPDRVCFSWAERASTCSLSQHSALLSAPSHQRWPSSACCQFRCCWS